MSMMTSMDLESSIKEPKTDFSASIFWGGIFAIKLFDSLAMVIELTILLYITSIIYRNSQSKKLLPLVLLNNKYTYYGG